MMIVLFKRTSKYKYKFYFYEAPRTEMIWQQQMQT